MKTKWEALLVFILLAAGSSSAQWVPTNGPYCGGDVNFLYAKDNVIIAGISAPHVSNPNLVPSQIFESKDNGESWASVYVARTETIFTSIVSVGKDLFVGSTTGIYKSTNDGKNWFEPDTSLRKLKVNSLTAISKQGATIVFAGTDESGVLATQNGGKKWNRSGLAFSEIYALATCHGDIYASTMYGLYVSRDGGMSWHSNGLRSYSTVSLAVMSDSILFAQTDGGIFYSSDRGDEWLVTNRVRGSRLLEVDGSDIFISSNWNLFVSSDMGKIWKSMRTGSPAYINSFCRIGKYQIVGTKYDGVYRSTDGGKSWNLINKGLMKAGIFHLAYYGNCIYAGTKGFGMFSSTDGGNGWIPSSVIRNTSNFPEDYVVSLEANGDNVCARTYDSLYSSTDNGVHWLSSDIGGRQGRGFAASLAVRDSEIFAGTNWGLLHSVNGGKTWTWSDSGMSLGSGWNHVPMLPPGIRSVPSDRESMILTRLCEVQAVAFKGPRVFAGVTGGDIFVSTDDGAYWTRVDSNLTRNFINALTVVGPNLFALTEGSGVFRSNDDGKTWEQINKGVSDLDAHVLVQHEKNLFLGAGDGVYLSTDDGDNWTRVNDGLGEPMLKEPIVIGLAVNDGYLYAGTWDNGVWKRSIDELVESASSPSDSK